MKGPAMQTHPPIGFAQWFIANKARITQSFHKLAKDYRRAAAEGIEPATNLRQARRAEASARVEEATIRALADSFIAQGVKQ